MTQDYSSRSILKAVLFVSGSTAVAYGASLVSNTLIARALGPSDYGRYSYMVWLSGVLIIMMNNGLTSTAIRFISETLGRASTSTARGLQRWFAQKHWWSIAVVSVLFMITTPHAGPANWDIPDYLLAAIALGAAIPKAWYIFGVSVAKGYGRFGIEASSMSLMSAVNLIVVTGCWYFQAHLYTFLGLFVLVNAAHPLMLRFINRNTARGAKVIRPDSTLRARVRPQLYWTSLLILTTTFSGIAMCMLALNRNAPAEAIGFFSVSVALTRGGVELLSSGLNSVLMPMMAHSFGAGGSEKASKMGADAMRIFHFFGLMLAGVGFFWSAPIILGMYGEKYAAATMTFQVLSVMSGLCLPLGVLGSLLSTMDQQSMRFKISLATLGISAVTAWTLIPALGLNGALLSLVCVNVAAYGFYVAAAVRDGFLQLPTQALLRLTAAALGAALVSASVMWVADNKWLHLLAGVLFIGLFPLGSLMLRAWYTEDLALLARQTHRLGRWGRALHGIERWGSLRQPT